MQNRFGLVVTDVMPIFMIIALDIVITMRFSINCSTVICLPTVCLLSRERPLVKPMAPGPIFHHIFSDLFCYLPFHLFATFIFRSILSKTQKYLAEFSIQWSLGDPYDVTLFAVCLLGSDEL